MEWPFVALERPRSAPEWIAMDSSTADPCLVWISWSLASGHPDGTAAQIAAFPGPSRKGPPVRRSLAPRGSTAKIAPPLGET